ncbi:hypothetical protein G7K_2200-t1 [Saitoella complicata NRRL Y-17804]|uniref:Uncharacterized protein n=1 Tax=Saitoella complicata (strain BCRC 22490 / CBS 7301 / JCM 7358 / NBRC 10748 / NRRL Y-17804) TaxID=698492 RepID=A0A0E9NDT2_SAICN|nr:hypothetical protein G7K_2200-t1 [Saitoella complicata NRRL Y-17804]
MQTYLQRIYHAVIFEGEEAGNINNGRRCARKVCWERTREFTKFGEVSKGRRKFPEFIVLITEHGPMDTRQQGNNIHTFAEVTAKNQSSLLDYQPN